MLPFPFPFPPPPPFTNHGRPPWLPDLPPPLCSSAAVDFRTTNAAFSSPFCPDSRCVYPGRGSEAWPAPPLAAPEVLEESADLLQPSAVAPACRYRFVATSHFCAQHFWFLFPCSSTQSCSASTQLLFPERPQCCRHWLKKMNVGVFLSFVHFSPSTPHSRTRPGI